MQRPMLVALMIASFIHAALIFGFRFDPPRSGQAGRARIAMTLVRPAPRVETPPAEPVPVPPDDAAAIAEAPKPPTPAPAPPETPQPAVSEVPPAEVKAPAAASAAASPPVMGPPRPGPAEAFVGPIQPARPPLMGPPAPSVQELKAARQRLAAQHPQVAPSPPSATPGPAPQAVPEATAGKLEPRPAAISPPVPRPSAPVASKAPVAEDDEEDEEPLMAKAEDEEEEAAPTPTQPSRPAPKAPVSARAGESPGRPPAPVSSSQPEGSPDALLPQPRRTPLPPRPAKPVPHAQSRVAPRREEAVTPAVPRQTRPHTSPPKSALSSPSPPTRSVPPPTATTRQSTQSAQGGHQRAGASSPGHGGKAVKPNLSAGLLSQQISEVSESIYMNRSLAMLDTKIVYAKDVKNNRLVVAAYEQAWQEKVEQHGNRNFPEEARRQKLSGSLVLAVGIQPDGRVYSVQVLQSSGQAVLDNAARHIVDLAAPFAPLPREIRQEVEVLVITRTWRFDSDFRLETRAR